MGLPSLTIGALDLASAVYGYSVIARCGQLERDALQQQQDERREHQKQLGKRQRQADAWILTKTAAAAARIGDCATVTELETKVRVLDLDFHDTIFKRDVAIARCLLTPNRVPAP